MKITALKPNRYCFWVISATLALLLYALVAPLASAQQAGVVTVDNPQANPPILAIYQNNTALSVVATDDNLDSNSWQQAGPFVADLECDSDGLVYGPAGADQRFLTLTPADNGQWYCFKVVDTDNNIGYAKHHIVGVVIEEEMTVDEMVEEEVEVEEGPLVLTTQQLGAVITVSASHDLANDQFEALIVASASSCNRESFERLSTSVIDSGRVSGLSWRDNGRHYCFRAADSDGNYVYAVITTGGLPVPPTQAARDNDQPEADDDDDAEAVDDDTDKADDDKDEDGAGTGADDGDGDESNNLRTVGIVVIVVGILAIIAVILFFNKKQPGQDADSDDSDDF